ncbi:proteasome subunit beta [Halosimplex pelagicum]|uniref:proteasome endopeptidase complex n=1 Tax=Halosimplex pelagicum TaxID=869886 RepID=A0A7D5TWX8_9EURY|nr:proteasome subunit beta [Halosimplex pelagicum]QLH84354.1 proteasome subunit beta [Halosimplex pelagicum]
MTLPNYGPADDDRLHELPHDELSEAKQIDHDAPTFDTGTTIVAIVADDGVVMAADQRASLGGKFTTNKNAEKISRVHPTAALAISGSVGPAQNLIRSLRAETSLYESRREEPMSMRALSQTAGHLVRGLPVAPILGGVDAEGGHVYELDGGGSVMATDYAAGGSGMQVAYGVLERRFDPEATGAAVAAVEAASERDTASGNGVTVATVTADGVDIEGYDETGDASGPGTTGEEVA